MECKRVARWPDVRCYVHTTWLHGTLKARQAADAYPSADRERAWALFAQHTPLKLPTKGNDE